MSYLWFIVCDRPVPQPPPPPNAKPFGVTKIDLKTGKQTFTPGGVVLLPKAPNPNEKPWAYLMLPQGTWVDEARFGTAYFKRKSAESEATVFASKHSHLIGHLRVKREKSSGTRIVHH